jgi:hypothetical protein
VKVTYYEAVAADGIKVEQWLQAGGFIPERVEAVDEALARRLRSWRAGGQARVDAVDKVCIKLGVHPCELPEDVWVDHYAAIPVETRYCETCSEEIPRKLSGEVRPSGRKKYQSANEYAVRRFCSQACSAKARLAGRPRAKA